MNKKSKRITLGLVSALCLLLVVALGFGVTGAWYRARRTANGTVLLDQGIILEVTNLDTGDSSDHSQLSPTSTVGQLWVLNDAGNGILPLTTAGVTTISTQPGSSATKNVIIPTIAAGTQAGRDSTPFYAKAKIVYEFIKFNNDRTLDTAHPLTLADLYTGYDDTANDNAGDKVAATLANIFADQLTFNNKWDATGMGNGYYLYTNNVTAGTPVAIAVDDNPVALFTAQTPGNDVTNSVANTTVDVVTLVDWTVAYDTSGNVNDYVEFGGPKFYAASQFGDGENQIDEEADLATVAPAIEIAQINIQVIIDVIQSENITSAALTAWKAAA